MGNVRLGKGKFHNEMMFRDLTLIPVQIDDSNGNARRGSKIYAEERANDGFICTDGTTGERRMGNWGGGER